MLRWPKTDIQIQKGQLKTFLDRSVGQDPATRLAAIEDKLSDLDMGKFGEDRRRDCAHLVALVFALDHHLRLSEADEQKLKAWMTYSHALLTLYGARPGVSTLSLLYGELHSMVNPISNKSGTQVLAGWEALLRTYLVVTDVEEDLPVTKLMNAHRLLRMGLGEEAWQQMAAIDPDACSKDLRAHVLASNLKMCRVTSHWDAFDQHFAAALEFEHKELALEIEWEKAFRDAVTKRVIDPVAELVKGDKRFAAGHFFMDAYLWMKARASIGSPDLIPQVQSYTRRKSADVSGVYPLYRACYHIERSYDEKIDMPTRRRELGDLLARIDGLANVDHALQVVIAASNWLRAQDEEEMAISMYKQYVQLSQSLTSGRADDAYSLLPGDLPDLEVAS